MFDVKRTMGYHSGIVLVLVFFFYSFIFSE